MSCCGQKARQCGSAGEELRGYLEGGRVVLHDEQMACVRVRKSGQMQAKSKTFLKWKGIVILGKSPKSRIPPVTPLVVAAGGLLQAKLAGLGWADKPAA